METIVATAFGRKLDVIGGEADDLTKAAQGFFEQTEEGSSTSRDKLVMLTSKCIVFLLKLCWSVPLMVNQCSFTGNFPWLIPIFSFLFSYSKGGKNNEKLVKIALELVNARRQTGTKVRTHNNLYKV